MIANKSGETFDRLVEAVVVVVQEVEQAVDGGSHEDQMNRRAAADEKDQAHSEVLSMEAACEVGEELRVESGNLVGRLQSDGLTNAEGDEGEIPKHEGDGRCEEDCDEVD